MNYSNFKKFGDFSKIYLWLILWGFFFKTQTGFSSRSTFHHQLLFFGIFVRIMNISLVILILFESRGFWGTWFMHNDRLEIWWRHQRDLRYYLVFFKRSLYYHSHTKFHNQGLTGSEIMTGVEVSFVTDYLMLKKPMLLRVKMASASIIWHWICYCHHCSRPLTTFVKCPI